MIGAVGVVGGVGVVVGGGAIGDVWRANLSRYFCQEGISLFWHIICFSSNACLLHGWGHGK